MTLLLKTMKQILYFFLSLLAFLTSCRSVGQKGYEYEVVIQSNMNPSYSPIKFISYKDLLFSFTFTKEITNLYKSQKDTVIRKVKLDSLERWIFDSNNLLCYKIDSFLSNFKIIGKDSVKNRLDGSIGTGYLFNNDLHDTTVLGVQYYISDSLVKNDTAHVNYRYYFIKNKALHTVYSILNMRHKNDVFKYAGFTMDDYKDNFYLTNLILQYKEVDAATLQKLEAIYQRFKRLQKSE
jgi:hypothetical protein